MTRSVPMDLGVALGVGLLVLSALSPGNARAQTTYVASPASASSGQAEIGEDLGRQPLSASPNDVDAQLLESDERARGLGSLAPETGLHEAWEGLVDRLRTDHGIELSLNYTLTDPGA